MVSFRKGQSVRLVLEARGGVDADPLSFTGTVLFSGNPYGKGHRTLMLTETQEKRWVRTDHLERNV